MRYLSIVAVLAAVDGGRHAHSLDKQVAVDEASSKTDFSHLKKKRPT